MSSDLQFFSISIINIHINLHVPVVLCTCTGRLGHDKNYPNMYVHEMGCCFLFNVHIDKLIMTLFKFYIFLSSLKFIISIHCHTCRHIVTVNYIQILYVINKSIFASLTILVNKCLHVINTFYHTFRFRTG